MNDNVNRSDDNIQEVQEQFQCYEWNCADELDKDHIQEVEMPHSLSNFWHRSANNDNDSRLGVEEGRKNIPLHQSRSCTASCIFGSCIGGTIAMLSIDGRETHGIGRGRKL